MDVRVEPKPLSSLLTTRLIQQTSYWSRVKRKLGWEAHAFDVRYDAAEGADGRPLGDVLVLSRPIGGGKSFAYSPFGPEGLPDDEHRGEYLAALSAELERHLGPGCIFVRWDLPWQSPYAEEEDRYDDEGHWLGPPETRLRELRMNWGLGETGLRKAPSDILPPDTFILDLLGAEDELLSRMRPKTRYNIRLAERKGVRVRSGGARDLDLWQRLYEMTARRNRIQPHGRRFFEALGPGSGDAKVDLLIAERQGIPLAAMFLSTSADRSTYLYGASSGEERHLMAPYALQWAAIRLARQKGSRSYDFFGASPRPDPEHPLFGLFQFKSGFGGRMVHRQGAWDFAFDESSYRYFLAGEAVSAGFHA